MRSYMAALEDTLNIGMCGLFLLLLAASCFVAFSAVTVKYLHFDINYLEFVYYYLYFEVNTNIIDYHPFITEFGVTVLLNVMISLLCNSGKARETISQFYPATIFFSASSF